MISGRLNGKVAIVTGGTSGIGLAIAQGYLLESAKVVIIGSAADSFTKPKVQKLFRDFPDLKFLALDMAKCFDAERVISQAMNMFDSYINVLVNNAAVFSRDSFINTSIKTTERVFSVNFYAAFELSKAFSKLLIARNTNGSIVNVSSLSAEMARSKMSAYQCSKAALEMLSKSIAYELAPFGIRSNVIAPGLTETEANQDQRSNTPEIWAQRVSAIPMARPGLPSDMVGAAVFLASDEADWITGAKIVIDGGLSCF